MRSTLRVELIETKSGFGGDHPRVVDVADRPQLEGRVVVEEAVEAVGSEGEGADGLGAVEVLADAGDDARFDEVDDAVGEQLGVDAEIVVIAQRVEDGVGDGTDADLDRGAIGDALGDVGSDAHVQVAARRRCDLEQRSVDLAPAGDLGDVQLVAPERPRHLRVRFEEEPGSSDERRGVVSGDPEAEVAVTVDGDAAATTSGSRVAAISRSRISEKFDGTRSMVPAAKHGLVTRDRK